MALDDWYSNTIFFLRVFHIMAGITWIGLLYFFNFVNVPFQGKLEKELKPKVNPELLPRALWWFRWAAMATFLIGLLLLLLKYGHGNLWLDVDGNLSGRTIWILLGSLLGTIMWFNVWFIIHMITDQQFSEFVRQIGDRFARDGAFRIEHHIVCDTFGFVPPFWPELNTRMQQADTAFAVDGNDWYSDDEPLHINVFPRGSHGPGSSVSSYRL